MTTKETQSFQTETKELLNLMIHSLYSNREIFLRELISNASDAIEKLKFESLTNSNLQQGEYEIRLEANPEARTLTITDNGIGMSRAEVVQNIGTIAHSGTKAFLKMHQEVKEHPELIGQFGVGFYSGFLVADRMTLHTQKAGQDGANQGVLWESDGKGSYSIEELPRQKGHGTTIILHLKDFSGEKEEGEAAQDFTDFWTIKELVKKYSDFIPYPVRMVRSHKDDKGEIQVEDEILNSQKALWLRSPSEIEAKDYNEFYKHLSRDWAEPLKTIHYRAEGAMEFVALLFLPSQKPYDYDYREREVGLQLYVKRVFIKGNCEELLPPYLRFIKGLVDSDDLSLNVSREILQQDRQILRIKKAITNKVLSSLKELLQSDRSSYEKFWIPFGPTLKEGVAMDSGSLDKVQELLLFKTSTSSAWTSLSEYVSRMKPAQKAIYYITGESLQQIENSPYLEKLKAKGFEVLFLNDHIDPWVVSHLHQYQEKPLQSITAEDLDLNTDEEKEQHKQQLSDAQEKFKPLLESIKEALKEQLEDVRISVRLTESPVCLVSSSSGTSAHMERILRSMGQDMPMKNKRILEINPEHPLYTKMLDLPKDRQQEWAEILYQQALLNEGSPIDNPLRYSQKIANLMLLAQ